MSLLVRLCAALAIVALTAPSTSAVGQPGVTILVYHRFGTTVKDAMTVRTSTFRWQLDYLTQQRRPIIPLSSLVSYLVGHETPPSAGSVVITADDGHESVFTDMLPIVREYRIPVTLFVYPSAISNASYAMTWAQLDAARRTGFFDIQSHTFWHPNFKTEKRRLSHSAYRAFATLQLAKAKAVLEDKLGVEAHLLAWPFGIYDDELIEMAHEAGYIAAFTLERRSVTPRDRLMALPRVLVTDAMSGQAFASMLREHQ